MTKIAILVHADGTTEQIDAEYAAGLYHYRTAKCGECGATKGRTRKYKVHWASDANTTDRSKGTAGTNEGAFVLIEEPA